MTTQSTHAICHRCGSTKKGPFVPCKSCGFVPEGDQRPISWLFSAHHLSADECSLAAQRIRSGELPDPSRSLTAYARDKMGMARLTRGQATPLSTWTMISLFMGNLAVTPLLGGAVWLGWRGHRPVAAHQVLWVTVISGIVTVLFWSAVLTR